MASAAEAAVESLAQLAAYGVAGPLGVPLGVVASKATLALTRKAADELSERRIHSAARMVEEAAEVRGSSPQDLIDEVMQHPDTAQLLADALQAAADTFDRRKVSALARALANGAATDGTRVDSERLMIRALADLDPAHIRLLQLLRRQVGREAWTGRRLMTVSSTDAEGNLVPMLNGDVDELMPVILRHGLAKEDADARWAGQVEALTDFIAAQAESFPPRNLPDPEEPEWVLTDFGRRALDYLRAANPGRS